MAIRWTLAVCAAVALAGCGSEPDPPADEGPDYRAMCEDIVTGFLEGELDMRAGGDEAQDYIWDYCFEWVDRYFGPPAYG